MMVEVKVRFSGCINKRTYGSAGIRLFHPGVIAPWEKDRLVEACSCMIRLLRVQMSFSEMPKW